MAQNFQQLISDSEVPVLVDFYADWCQPCHMMAPELKKVAQQLDSQLKVLKVDVDRNQAAANKYQIRGIPTLILFHKGKVIWRHSGVIPASRLIQALSPHLSRN